MTAAPLDRPLDLYTLADGHGLPLLLLHGFPFDHRMWQDVADLLPSGTTALAVDLPGLGSSRLGSAPASLDESADATVRTLRDAGVGRAVVAGLSMGGYVALAIAERHPAFVAGLGLVDTRSTADTDDARAGRLRMAAELSRTQRVEVALGMPGALLGATSKAQRPGLTARLEEWIRVQRPDGVAWSQEAMAARPDRTAVLPTLTVSGVPVTVVVGEEDTLTPPDAAQHMADAAGSDVVSVPGSGHMSAVEDPQAVAAALGALLARSSAV